MFYIDIEHAGLKKFRRIQGRDIHAVEQRARAQRQVWEEQWARKCETERTRDERARRALFKEQREQEAVTRTDEAQRELTAICSILRDGLGANYDDIWSPLYDQARFSESKPTVPKPTPKPPEPPADETVHRARYGLLTFLFPSIKRQREAEAKEKEIDAKNKYERARAGWAKRVEKLIDEDQSASIRYQSLLEDWKARKVAFSVAQAAANARIDAGKAAYMKKEAGAVAEYMDMVLSRSDYPDCFPKQFRLDNIVETGVVVVDYELPAPESFPTLKAVKYIQSRNSFEEMHLREGEIARLYDEAMYQTALRTIYEIFASDAADAVRSVTFNGWVDFTDKATGQRARSCIMSVQTTKEVFGKINLWQVEPRACFRSLKGVGSAKLAGMAAVVPILLLNREDNRFVVAHDAITKIDEATNIAAIPWEEFEYLVRDVFEKEFSTHGGEVKITRASRDHGVDAVAFDPDPIRGGKIVIQAKRYTNVVGVSAVRDLYGTLINEGANRGILVTTSQYGSDSYAFAKDKPITLLDGGNLLSLLERHGHKARIDLVEARQLGTLREGR